MNLNETERERERENGKKCTITHNDEYLHRLQTASRQFPLRNDSEAKRRSRLFSCSTHFVYFHFHKYTCSLSFSLFLFRTLAHIHEFNLRVTKISTISTTHRMNEMNGAPNSYSKTIWSIHRVNREKIAKYKTNMYTQHIQI